MTWYSSLHVAEIRADRAKACSRSNYPQKDLEHVILSVTAGLYSIFVLLSSRRRTF